MKLTLQTEVSISCFIFKTLLSARGDFRYLLITFANSLDPDQAGRFVGADLDQTV